MTETYDRIFENIDPIAFISNYVQLRKSGNSFRGKCPFHEEKTPSFFVSADTGLWKCFGCGEGGNLLTFRAKKEGISNGEAFQKFAQEAGVKLEKDYKYQANPFLEILEESIFYYNQFWLDSAVAENFAMRFLVDEDIHKLLNDLKVGYVPKESRLRDHLLQNGFKLEMILKSNLVKEDGSEYFAGYIILPSWSNGHVVWAQGRRVDSGEPKFKNLTKPPYETRMFNEAALRSSTVYICEGPIDAITLMRLKYPAVGIPGAASMRPDWYKKFDNVKKVYICLDSYDYDAAGKKAALEIGSNMGSKAVIIKFPAGNDVNDYLLSHQKYDFDELAKEAKSAFQNVLAELPETMSVEEWKERLFPLLTKDSGIQLDKNLKEIAQKFNVTTDSVESELKGTQKSKEIKTKVIKDGKTSTIIEADNRYYKVKYDKKGKEVKEPISNFVMKILKNFKTAEGIIREVELINIHGIKEGPFMLQSTDMDTVQHFRNFSLKYGPFNFSGGNNDLTVIWDELFSEKQPMTVRQPDGIGEINTDGECFWLFGNKAYYKGEVIEPNEEGLFLIKGIHYKPRSLVVAQDESRLLPMIIDKKKSEAMELLQEFSSRFTENLGTNYAKLGIGWALANAYFKEFFKEFHLFPILFVTGPRMSGKNTYIRWIMNLFGMAEEGDAFTTSTTVGMSRRLYYYSSIPYWIDEFRDDGRSADKISFLRSVFDRKGFTKGVKEPLGASSKYPRGTLVISGENTPNDPAFVTRLILARLSERERNDQLFTKVDDLSMNLSCVLHNILIEKNGSNIGKIIDESNRFRSKINKAINQPRSAICYGIAGSVYNYFIKDEDFLEWLIYEVGKMKDTDREEDLSTMFLEQVNALFINNKIPSDFHITESNKAGEYFLCLHMTEVWGIWADTYRRRYGVAAPRKREVVDALKDKSFFVELDYQKFINGKNRKCIKLDLDKIPQGLLDFFEGEGHEGKKEEGNGKDNGKEKYINDVPF